MLEKIAGKLVACSFGPIPWIVDAQTAEVDTIGDSGHTYLIVEVDSAEQIGSGNVTVVFEK
jgi:hypothetical protein